MISEFCIRRPVATLLMSLALILAGVFSYKFLPVAALPSAEFPVVNVSASLPGASPETMATSVATPLIKQFATIAGIDSISTTNSLGSTSIAIQFVLNRDIDAAAADVQAAIARAQRSLPSQMTSTPSYRKVNPADAPILIMTLVSDTVPLTQLNEFAENVISPSLSTINGVAQVMIWGQQKYAVRIQIDPTALAARGISIDQLQNAIASANSNTPLGVLKNDQQQLTIVANTQLENAEGFSNIIIATKNGRPIRLGEVTRVVDSVETTTTAGWYDGSRSIMMAVQRQPDANTVDVVDRVKAMIPAFAEQLPGDAQIKLLNDRSTSIREAVDDVQFTLILTIALVVLVIFIFLRRITATIIPAVAVPISLIATLAAMYVFGFSINNISLMALTLAVGLVVDDAIVMLENIFRHMEEDGLPPFEAALKGSREIGFTIISISISLVAVFIPVLLMGGVIGRIFNEFAVVVTVAILASMFVSLTLTPMLSAYLLKQMPGRSKEEAEAAHYNNWSTRVYDKLLKFGLKNHVLIFIVFLVTAAMSGWLIYSSPKGFFPQEDINQVQVTTNARQDISFEAMVKLQNQVAEVFQKSPYVEHVGWSAGGSGQSMNQGRLFVQLKPKADRPNMDTVLAELRKKLAQVPGINAYMTPTQNLRLGARSSAAAYQLVVQGLDNNLTNEWAQKLTDAMQADRSLFADVNNDLQISALQATLVVDRDKASQLGIDTDTLRSSLYGGFGTQKVSTIYSTADSYEVIMELDPRIEWSPERMLSVKVRTADNRLVPMGSFARVERTAGVLTVNQLGQLPAVTISYNLPEGVSLGQSTQRIEQIKQEIGLPGTVFTSYAGTTQIFQDSLSNQTLLILGAILTIYIVLGMLYESFIHPLTILTGLPSAVLGALISLRLFGMDLSVIAVIGLLMLIGIVKKNGIMMVDVAMVLRREGASAYDAIHKASVMRFRPIMMTTMAAIMGVLPIAIGHGASAELRQPLGVAVVGGLIASQILTLFVTPVIYLYFEWLATWLKEKFGRKIDTDDKTPTKPEALIPADVETPRIAAE